MAARDIAPSLHFVDPGRELDAVGWVGVVGGCVVPNCTALMELGRKFLLTLDNAPSRASRLASEHCSSVLHDTVEFQPSCSPDLSPLDFFLWNETTVQLVQHPGPANPAELRALWTRVCHRTWAGSREMFEKIGNAWVRRGRPHVVEPCCSVTHHRTENCGHHSLILKMGQEVPKTLKASPFAHYFF